MNTTDSLIQGLLSGLLFTIVGGIIYAISRGANKIINKRKIEIEKGLNIDFGQGDFSLETRMAIFKLLARIAECDGVIDQKPCTVFLIVSSILGLDRVKSKTLETIEDEFNKKSNDELLEYLSGFNSIQKEWLLKAIIFLMESDTRIREKEINFIQPILTKMGIRKK